MDSLFTKRAKGPILALVSKRNDLFLWLNNGAFLSLVRKMSKYLLIINANATSVSFG